MRREGFRRDRKLLRAPTDESCPSGFMPHDSTSGNAMSILSMRYSNSRFTGKERPLALRPKAAVPRSVNGGEGSAVPASARLLPRPPWERESPDSLRRLRFSVLGLSTLPTETAIEATTDVDSAVTRMYYLGHGSLIYCHSVNRRRLGCVPRHQTED